MIDNQTLDPISAPYKLYSSMSIRIATFLGTPIAAGFLIRKNFVALGEEDKGRNALIVAIIATLLMFAGLYMVPEQIMDKVPNLLIPIVYMVVVHYYVDITQGPALKSHEGNSGEFYSGWRAAGIGLLVFAIMVPAVFAYAYYGPQDFDLEAYDAGFEKFQKNEEEALTVYDIDNDFEAAEFIQDRGIPLWEENMGILQELNKIDGLYPEYIDYNDVLHEYSELLLKSLQLLEKALREQSTKYDRQLENVYEQINTTLDKLE
ncbi:MAG: hypothetical protein GQ574_20660 [Crocinitomix sp.]|nr:hypothetical protein [Crocinitomix sp.]